MRIGEVARQVGLTVGSVRYYINSHLLIPRVKNGQYVFSESDIEELKFIIHLKKLRFSLNDIHRILSLMRVSNLQDRGDIDTYLELFHKQRTRLLLERAELDNAIAGLFGEIEQIETSVNSSFQETGVPLSMLEHIHCPHCQRQLNLKDAYLVKKYILSGEFVCSCGYSAYIKDGILCTHGRHISTYDYPDLERSFETDIPSIMVSAIHRASNWMIDHLNSIPTDGKVIMEDHLNAYALLYPAMSKVNHSAQYIMADKYFEIVKMYKSRIDQLNLDLDILYLCDSSFDLPLKQGCVDVFIDYFASNEYNFFNHEYLLDRINYVFQPDAMLIGTYFSFKRGSNSMKQAMIDYPETWVHNFNLDRFKSYFLGANSFQVIEDSSISEITDTGTSKAFSFHQHGEPMNLYSFCWQKVAE